jgi:sugar lactone lactonase YvrE
MTAWTCSLSRLSLGEGPLWHPQQQCLYVTDLRRGTVHVFDVDLNPVRQLEFGRATTAITWQRDDSLLFFHDGGEVSRVSASGTEIVLQLPDQRAPAPGKPEFPSRLAV